MHIACTKEVYLFSVIKQLEHSYGNSSVKTGAWKPLLQKWPGKAKLEVAMIVLFSSLNNSDVAMLQNKFDFRCCPLSWISFKHVSKTASVSITCKKEMVPTWAPWKVSSGSVTKISLFWWPQLNWDLSFHVPDDHTAQPSKMCLTRHRFPPQCWVGMDIQILTSHWYDQCPEKAPLYTVTVKALHHMLLTVSKMIVTFITFCSVLKCTINDLRNPIVNLTYTLKGITECGGF